MSPRADAWDRFSVLNEFEPEIPEVVHLCPPGDENLTPCCGRSPLGLIGDRITLDPELVTCRGGRGVLESVARNVQTVVEPVETKAWVPGDPCGVCGSRNTWWDPADGGVCGDCGATDADE